MYIPFFDIPVKKLISAKPICVVVQPYISNMKFTLKRLSKKYIFSRYIPKVEVEEQSVPFK